MFVRGSGIIVSAPTFRRRSPPRRVPAYMRRSGRVPSVCVSDSSSSVAILRSERDRLAGPGELSGSLFLAKDSVRIERDERASPRDARAQMSSEGPSRQGAKTDNFVKHQEGAMRTKSLLSSTWIMTCGVAALAAVVWFSLPAAKVSAQSGPMKCMLCPSNPQNACTECCNDSYEMCHMAANENHKMCLESCIGMTMMGGSTCRQNCNTQYHTDQGHCVDCHKSCLGMCNPNP